MKKRHLLQAGLAALLASLTGCVGYNTAFTGTTSNVGLNIDTKTPTAEVSIARREVAVAPAFEGGYVPPVAASYKVKGVWIAARVSSTFTGGDAAATMAKENTTSIIDTSHRLSSDPVGKGLFQNGKHVVKHGDVRPFVFATDSSLGLKLGWSGLTAHMPDTAKLGFNRKEMALAPVTAKESNGKTLIKMPSFLATTDSDTKAGTPAESEFKHSQYFATGAAADQLALRSEIREVMFERLDPAAAKVIETHRNEAEAVAKPARENRRAKYGGSIEERGESREGQRLDPTVLDAGIQGGPGAK
jgi:hypothetical protein